MRNKIRQTTHISPVEIEGRDSVLGEGKQDKWSILPEFREETVKVQVQNTSK